MWICRAGSEMMWWVCCQLSKKNAAECIVAKLKELPVTVRSRTSGRAGTNKKTSANNKSHNLLKPTSSTDVSIGIIVSTFFSSMKMFCRNYKLRF